MPQWERIARGIWVAQHHIARGDETWHVIVRRQDHEGGRKRIYPAGPDRGVAQGLAKDILRDLAAAGSHRVNVSALLSEFEAGHVRKLRRRTERLYLGLIGSHLKPFFGDARACELDRARFFDFGVHHLAELDTEERIKRFALVKNALSVMRTGLNWYWKEHEPTVPCPARFIAEEIERLRARFEIPRNSRKKPYTDAHRLILLEEAAKVGVDVQHIFWVAFGCGLRLGEVLGLEWTAIDYEEHLIRPEWQIDDRGEPTRPKHESDEPRIVHAAPDLFEMLLARYVARRSDRWVFSTRAGKPYRPRNVERWISKVRTEAAKRGVPLDRTFHSTRHYFASTALEKGWSYEEVARQLAHHSGAFTAKVYTHAGDRRPPVDWAAVTPTGHSGHNLVTVVTAEEGGDDVTPRKMERETGIEPATLSLGS